MRSYAPSERGAPVAMARGCFVIVVMSDVNAEIVIARYHGAGRKISKALDPARDHVARFRKRLGPAFDVMVRAFHGMEGRALAEFLSHKSRVEGKLASSAVKSTYSAGADVFAAIPGHRPAVPTPVG